MTAEPTRRLFFALWPDPGMQSALAEATRALTGACDGRVVPTENFHLTLAFLGSVPESKLASLTRVAETVADAFRNLPQHPAPIAIALDEVEHWRKPELLCATASEPAPAATALAQVLKEALVAGGFTPDLKTLELVDKLTMTQFRPHVTLARKVRHPIRTTSMNPLLWSFSEFALVESRTGPQGSVYRVLESYLLS